MNNEDQLRYPIGKFTPKDSYSAQEVQENIKRIEALPAKVEALIKNFSQAKLDAPYRDGGWSARQVVHHLADSHMNAYIRFKWTLTENTPIIKVYDEKSWAETSEVKLDPVISLDLLKPLHIKWTAMLRLLGADELKKEFIHPETKKHIRLDRLIALYSWHGDHHLGHLEIVAKK